VQAACHRSGLQLQHSTTEPDLLCSKCVHVRTRVFIREQCRFSSAHSVICISMGWTLQSGFTREQFYGATSGRLTAHVRATD